MDGSTHPENTAVAEFPGRGHDPFAADSPPSAANQDQPAESKEQHNSHDETRGHVLKRVHDGTDAEDAANDAKRIHADDDDDDDDDDDEFDLDLIMAQLQQHTEQAADNVLAEASLAEPSNSEASRVPENQALSEDKNAQAEQDPQAAELSIEQQLKGALSSFQEFGLMERDNDASEEDFQLSHFAPVSRPDESQETSQQMRSPETASPVESAQRPKAYDSDKASTSGTASVALPRPRVISGRLEGPMLHPGDDHGPRIAQEDRANKASRPSVAKDTLASQMPPLPARDGQLPPMPPPPAALTTPTAPLNAKERSYHVNRGTQPSGHGPLLENEPNRTNSEALKPRKRLPDAPPSLSEKYEKSLAEQVEEARREADDQPRLPALNDNQAILQARRKTVTVLDSLAAQILEALGCNHYQETLATVTQPKSEKGLAYRLLLDAFEDAKRLFLLYASPSSRNGPESKPEEVRPFLENSIPGIELNRDNTNTIQRANLATFAAAVFGTIEIGFWELDKWFIQTFVPEGGRLLKQQANIYLDLKTQAYISAVESTTDEQARKAAINDLFPDDLDQKLREMFGDRAMLAPSERDFVEKCKRRRENIEAEDAKDLSSKYHWVPFLRELSDYVQKNHYTLLPPRQRQPAQDQAAAAVTSTNLSTVPCSAAGTRVATTRRAPPPASVAAAAASGPTYSSPRPGTSSITESTTVTSSADALSERESGSMLKPEAQEVPSGTPAQTAEKAIRLPEPAPQSETASSSGVAAVSRSPTEEPRSQDKGPQPNGHDAPQRQLSREELRVTESGDKSSSLANEGHPMFPPLPKQVLPPPGGTSADAQDRSAERSRRPGPRPAADAPLVDGPTDTLAAYEAARASAEGTDAVRPRASMFTTRRIWTKEEEEALMKGMDRVQGPYWAQILELYGPGGKISEVLKDRSQVQLKDKARNLKMFFVRLGLPIPAVFQYVTGDYETRKSSGKRIRERKQKSGQTTAAEPGFTPAVPAHRTDVTTSQESLSHRPTTQEQAAASSPVKSPLSAPPLVNSSEQRGVDQPSQPHAIADTSVATANAQESSEDDGKAPPPRDYPMDTTSGGDPSVEKPSIGREKAIFPSSQDANSAEHELVVNDIQPEPSTEQRDQNQQKEKVTDYGELFSDGDDKDDDINSLLSRVGEFVDNH